MNARILTKEEHRESTPNDCDCFDCALSLLESQDQKTVAAVLLEIDGMIEEGVPLSALAALRTLRERLQG